MLDDRVSSATAVKHPGRNNTLSKIVKESAPKCIGFSISLGKTFVEEGMSDIDHKIFPKLKKMLPGGVWPRVVPGYATLLWFTEKVGLGFGL